jgi:hypothetical protein
MTNYHLTTALCYGDSDAANHEKNHPLLPNEEEEKVPSTDKVHGIRSILMRFFLTGLLVSSLAIGPITIILRVWGPPGSEQQMPTTTAGLLCYSALSFLEHISVVFYMMYMLLWIVFTICLTRRGALYFHKTLQLAKRPWLISPDKAEVFLFAASVSFFMGFALGGIGWDVAAGIALQPYVTTVAFLTVFVYWILAVISAGGVIRYFGCDAVENVSLESMQLHFRPVAQDEREDEDA